MFVAVVCWEEKVGVDAGVGELKNGNDSRGLVVVCGLASGEARRLLAIEGVAALGGAAGLAGFSDDAFGDGDVREISTVAGGALASTVADMAAGKLDRQFPKISKQRKS
jgi:hypothetical protein